MILPSLPRLANDIALDAMSQALHLGNVALQSLTDATARALANLWITSGYATTDALAVLGTNAAAVFAQHAAAVAYLWADADCRAAFQAACLMHGVTVATDPATQAPVFGQMLPYTAHPDGTITLN